MNKDIRKKVDKAIGIIEQQKRVIEFIKDNEEIALENTPENFINGVRYTSRERAIESLDCAVNLIEEALDNMKEAVVV